MENINIKYDTGYDDWLEEIKEKLKINNIEDNGLISLNILNSFRFEVYNFLDYYGYKPKDELTYRQGLVKKLKESGIELEIKSNEIMWQYLDYFTDIIDYKKAIDIDFKVIDEKKALETCNFYNTKAGITMVNNHPKRDKKYYDWLNAELNHASVQNLEDNTRSKSIDTIIEILKKIVKEGGV